MTNSGGYNAADNKVADAENKSDDETAMTESGEISTGANANEIFSDSVPINPKSKTADDENERSEAGKN